MPTIGVTVPTLVDVAKRTDPDRKIASIVELLNETNPILEDMAFVEGNLPTGHKTTVRTGLPDTTWRMLNYGVQPSKSTTAQVVDTVGELATMSEVDAKIAALNGNTNEFLLTESRAALESLNQEMASTLFYGNTTTDPQEFMGLAPRYNSLSTNKSLIGYNVIDAGGDSTDNTSIWLVSWGPNTIHGIFPKGSKAGVEMRHEKNVMLEDAANGKYPGHRSYYSWNIGLCVRDWRAAVRICNICEAHLNTNDTPALIDEMVKAVNRARSLKLGRPVWYMNDAVHTALELLALNKTNVHLSFKEFDGYPVLTFRGIPIKKCDALLMDEAQVT